MHRFPNVPVEHAAIRSAGTSCASTSDVLDGLRRSRAGGRSRRLGRRRLVGGRLRPARPRAAGSLQNPVHYRDARRAGAMESVLDRGAGARALRAHGHPAHADQHGLRARARWPRSSDPALDAAETLLLIPDLVHYWLCGRARRSSRTRRRRSASTRARGTWAADLLERLDIPSRLLPEVVQPGTRLGRLSDDVAEATGLGGRGRRRRGDARHRLGCRRRAVPRPGSVFISAGTWSLVGVEVERPLITDATFAANLTNEGGVGGDVPPACATSPGSGSCTSAGAPGRSRAASTPSTSSSRSRRKRRRCGRFIEPNDPAFAEPGDMPARVARSALTPGSPSRVEPGAVVRCILESLALKHAQTIDVLASVTGTAPAEIHVVGGGARNELLCRWTASAAGLPVLAGPEEATLLGNLLVQAMALGEIASLAGGARGRARVVRADDLRAAGAGEMAGGDGSASPKQSPCRRWR